MRRLRPVRLLIIKLSALGDVVHTLPALTTLRRHRPDAEISWLVEDASAGLVEGHPALNRCLALPRREWSRLARTRRWLRAGRGLVRFVREFRRTEYDLALDFQGLAKSGLWMMLARSRRKAGFGRGSSRTEGAWLALSERVPPLSADVHALDRSLHLLEALGFPRLPVAYDLLPGPGVGAEVDRLLRDAGLDPSTGFVAINPMTRWLTKDWEPGRFAAVADRLQEAGFPVVFTGAPGDREAIDLILDRMTVRGARVDGRTSLMGLAEVCRRARVVLSTDTGPMHVAVAMGTPVVALFGPTAPWRTGPHGPGHVVLRVGLDCSPCFRRRCQTTQYEARACMLRIDVNEVVAAVLSQAAGGTR